MTPLIHLSLILAIWVLCQLFPRRHSVHVLTLTGFMGLCLFAPVAAGFIVLICIQAVFLVQVLKGLARSSNWRKYGAYLLLLNLFFVDIHHWLLSMPVVTLAISFSVIRVFMTTKHLLSSRKALHPTDAYWIFPAGFFLPAIVIGPVFSGTLLRDQFRGGAQAPVVLRDARLVLQGLVLAVLVAPYFGNLTKELGELPEIWGLETETVFVAVLFFLQLFAAFWGQSLIAEHTTRFFGYELPVNFDRPWKARTIKEFWARWHRSIAGFVVQYIFLPLQLRGVPPRLATITAFVFMGLWHNLSLGYLVWGLVHGVLMAFGSDRPANNRTRRFFTRIGLWGIVIFLSWFANYGPWS